MKRTTTLFLFFIFCFGLNLFAIHPIIRNFSKKATKAGTQNWDIIQHKNNWMYFANNNGLLEFDGYRWTIYPISNYTNIRSLYYDEKKDRIYAGAFNEFGYYSRDDNGILVYTSLKDIIPDEDKEFNEIWHINNIDNTLFFQGGNEIFRYKANEIKRYDFTNRINFSATVYDIFFVSVENEGIFMLNGDIFLPLPNSDLLKNKKMCGILPFDKNRILFVTEFDGFYLFNGEKVTAYKTDIDDFMRRNQVFCSEIKDSKLAIGTVRNGLVVKDLNDNSNTYSNINSGLQNNTILSMKFDNQHNLWVGLDKGIDYIMVNSPVYDLFANNQLYGSGYTSLIKGDFLYLGTNQGLYSMKYPIQNTSEAIDIEFIPGMQGQVWNLKLIDNTVFCATNFGFYIIEGNRARKINGIPGTWNLIELKTKPGYILGSSYDGFFLLKKVNGNWVFSKNIKGFNESGGMFEEDKNGNIWFSHWMKGVFKLTLNSTLDSMAVETYGTDKGFYTIRNNVVFKLDDEIIFSGDGGFFVYDENENEMKHAEEIESIFGRQPYSVRLFQSPRKDIWALTSNNLELASQQADGNYIIDRITFSTLKSKLIPGFEQLYFIDDSRLIISMEDGFSWVDLTKTDSIRGLFKVAIRNVYITTEKDSLVGGYIASQQEIPEFKQKYNSLRFEFAAPEFREDAAATYSCFLENYDSDWSMYSTINTKEYTKLPQGEYIFHVKAQSLLTAETAETAYKFVILPPWYKSLVARLIYVVLILVAVYFLLILVNKRSEKGALEMKKQKEKEMQEQEERFMEEKKEKEQEITNLKNQRLQYELRHKSRDLASSTMNLIRKNEILLEINQDLDKITDDIKNAKEASATLKRIAKVQVDIKKNIERDDNWKKFEENFDLVYENYLKRLGETFPTLTVSDKKLCAYLKMGLSSKDIAPLLNMSFRSVEMSRYRLRKKLNLEREINLTEFLQNF